MKKCVKLIQVLIKNIIGFICCLFVLKSRKRCIVGGWFGEGFTDNSKYIYVYLSENKDIYNLDRVTWVTDNFEIEEFLRMNGLDVVKKNSLKGIWAQLRSKYHIIDQSYNNINPYTSYFSKRIQLWHGVGFKNISNKSEVPKNCFKIHMLSILRSIKTPGRWNKYIFLSTSKFATKNIFNLSFNLWENKVIENNYPRNIYLCNSGVFNNKYILNEKHFKLLDVVKSYKDSGKKIILYMPTYRGFSQVGSEKEVKPILNVDLDELVKFNEFIKNEDIVFLNKEHFVGKKSIKQNLSNIINIDQDLDIYPILKSVDCLITDYSSIYADFLFLDKPVIFYAYDLKNYMDTDKSFLFDYNEVTPGDKVFYLNELKSAIKENLSNDRFSTKRDKVKRMYFGENIDSTMDDLVRKILR